MTRSDQLRQALEPRLIAPRLLPVYEAARFALKVWEGDQQLVEKVAKALQQGSWKITTTVDRPLTEGHLFAKARAVLAALAEGEDV